MSAATVQGTLGVLAAIGLLALLVRVPVGEPRERWVRVAGLALAAAAWVGLAVSVLPQSAIDRLSRPVYAVAAILATVVVVAAGTWLGRFVERYPAAWFVALGVALPLRIPVPIGGDTRNLLLPLYVVMGLGVLAWAWANLRGRVDAPRSPLDLPVAVMTALSLASIAWSVDRTEGSVKAVFFYVPFALLYVAVGAWWPRTRAARTLALTTVAVAIPVALLALWQYQTEHLLLNERLAAGNKYSSFFRVNAIFFDPNILGRFLVVAILAVVAIAWITRDRPRALAACGVVLVPLCAGLAVTFSRSSCLMLIAGIALLAWWAFGGRRTVAVGCVVFALLGGAAVVSSGHVRQALTNSERLNKVSEGRFGLMKGGLDIWRESPVVGSGLGGFETQFSKTLTEKERRRTRVVISHNAPITVLSELGVLGGAALAWLCVAAGVVIRRRARAIGGTAGWIGWTMLAVLAGIFIHTLFYSALFEDPYCWVLLAGAVAVTAVSRAPESADDAEIARGTGTPA